jgi:hypothetical protein
MFRIKSVTKSRDASRNLPHQHNSDDIHRQEPYLIERDSFFTSISLHDQSRQQNTNFEHKHLEARCFRRVVRDASSTLVDTLERLLD